MITKIVVSLSLFVPSLCYCQFMNGVPPAPQRPAQMVDQQELQQLLQVKQPELTLHPQDVISVQVYGIKDYAIEQRIAMDGTVALPLVGAVQLQGLTVQQAENVIAEKLSSGGMVKDPQVTVRALSQAWAVVTISGAVGKPGTFPATPNLTLIDYISQAGGLNQTLQGNTVVNSPASSIVTLIRPSLEKPINIPLGPDASASPYARIPMLPGDEVRVGRVGVVYAVGALKLQGAFPLKSDTPTTVLQLIAQAGGIGFEADKSDAHIIRTDGNSRFIVAVSVADIMKGKKSDIALQSDDILFVPTVNMRAAIKGGGAGLVVSLASAGLYRY